MRRCWIALLFLTNLPSYAAAQTVLDPAIRDLIDEALKVWEVPGVAVAVVRDDQILYLGGHGVRELGKADRVTEQTLFPLASCSKAFTSLLMGTLVDDGLLDWDDPVRKHLPDFQLSDPNASNLVTLRDLLSHRTGVAPHDLLWYRAPWSHAEMIRRVGKLPLEKPFRTNMLYQSVMVLAAGEAMAWTAKKPWDELVRERILKPLEMTATSLETVTALKYPDRASGHRPDADGKVAVTPWYELKEPNASGSVNSTAKDLAAWLQLQLHGGEYHGKRIISAKNLEATHSPTTIIDMNESDRKLSPETSLMSYGMGWVIQDHRGEKLVSHTGLIDGFRTHLTLVPRHKIGIAVLSNLHGTRMNLAISHAILDHLLKWEKRDWNHYYRELIDAQEFAERAAKRRFERSRKFGTRPTLALSECVGSYEHPAYGTLTLALRDEQLLLEWSSFKSPLEHWHFDLFRLKEDFLAGRTVEFQFGSDGKLEAIQFLDQRFLKKKPTEK